MLSQHCDERYQMIMKMEEFRNVIWLKIHWLVKDRYIAIVEGYCYSVVNLGKTLRNIDNDNNYSFCFPGLLPNSQSRVREYWGGGESVDEVCCNGRVAGEIQ